MKRMNRVLSLLLALCMLATLLPARVSAVDSEQVTASPIAGEGLVQGETQSNGAGKLVSPMAGRQEALEANAPQQAGELQVTGQKIEKPSDVGSLTLQEQPVQQEQDLYAPQETVRAIVVLKDKGLLEQGFHTSAIAEATAQVVKSQEAMLNRQETVLQAMQTVVDQMDEPEAKLEVRYHYTIAVNGMAVELPYGALEEIQALDGVEAAFVAPRYDVPQDMSGETSADPYTYATSTAVGAVQTWDVGYTGAGMRIAVIDTGLDLDHPSFAEAPENPSLTMEEVGEVLTSLNASKLYRGLTAQRVYRSEKVPYAFNYVDETLDVTHDNDNQGDHGTHVAGISAANHMETTEVVGVAPDAQLLIMKVFGSKGGAFFDDIMAALEDCYVLNADVVNMSLGTPAGFSSISSYIDGIFARILDSDMVVAVAAGNSASAASMNGYGTDRNLTTDPDNGIVSSPATYVGSTSVASVENATIRYQYVELENGEKVIYNDVAATPITSLYWTDPLHMAEYVMIPGVGTEADFQGAGPSLTDDGDKRFTSIAVVQRGAIDFTAKQANAKNAGFDACFVYDNVEGDFLNMADGGLIPNAFLTKAGGEVLKAAADEHGRGMLYLKDMDETQTVVSSVAGEMSGFSSWGVSPDLQLNPEITAPGGNIYSTLTNGHYGTMSGTSMASPQVAGMGALVLQYLHQTYGDMKPDQMHTVAESLLMSTAVPVLEEGNVPYSPRKQGAGSANVLYAVTSPVYLTVEGAQEQTPKVSFGDDDERTGVYRFSFQMNNLTAEPQTYTLDGQALTDQFVMIDGLKFMSETSRLLDASVTFSMANGQLPMQYDYNGDGATDLDDVQAFLNGVNGLAAVKEGYDLTADGVVDTADVQKLYELISDGFTALSVVEVPANGAVTVYATVTLTSEDKAYMDENYPNGIYVDGFVRAYALTEGAVDLSLPFLGFYGDWSQPPVFDSAWYYETNPVPNRYVNVLFTDYGTTDYNLGLNPYIVEPHDPAHNVLSPNGDGYLDQISEIYLGMMRNAKLINFTWQDAEGNMLFNAPYDYALKNYYFAAYDLVPPLIYSEVCEKYDFKNADGSYAVEDLDRVKLNISAFLDDGDDQVDDVIETEVVIDTQAPTLDLSSLDYFYSEKTDSRLLRFTVSDNYDIAAVVALTKAGSGYEYIPVTTKEPGVDGETATITLDVSKFDSAFQIAVCDYGCNESYYEISFSGVNNYNEDAFYAYRMFSAVPSGQNIVITEAYNGWHSFESADSLLMHTSMFDDKETYVYAAEYVDGYIIGIDSNSEIFTMKAGDWNRTVLGKLAVESIFEFYPGGYETGDYMIQTVEYPALDMAMDYTTKTLYVLTDESMMNGPGSGGHLLTLDWLTGTCTDLGKVTGLTDDHQALTLACDNEGVLYTVDADTGDLYTLNKTTAVASFVGETGFVPQLQQTMAVDHETDKLYWAAYQGYEGDNRFLELNKQTGEVVSATKMEYNSQLSSLYKPYEADSTLVPEDTALTGLSLTPNHLTLKAGDTSSLRCLPQPYYAKLDTEEMTWSSSDASVATVQDGTVTAVGTGVATITATCGDLTATCEVTVISLEGTLYAFDFGTDEKASNTWLSLDVNNPQGAASMPGTQGGNITAAAYANGFVYAFDNMGGFHRLDPQTMQGVTLKPGNNQLAVTAMAFNYADGYMYALLFDQQSSFSLCRVNLHTGELRLVMDALEMSYGTPLGGMAIDYTGRIYLMGVSANDSVRIASFKLEDLGDGSYYGAEPATARLPGLGCNSFGSMVYSAANDGIFWANELGQLYWLGLQLGTDEWGDVTMEVSPVLVGELGKTVSTTTGQSMNMGLLERVANEPELPHVEMTSASMPETLTVSVEGSVQANVAVEPWNAIYTVEYVSADPTIATVNEYGVVTGVRAGKTSITATIYAADGSVYKTLTSQVKSVNSNVDVFCYMFTDGQVGGDCWLRVNGAKPAEVTVEANYELTIYAATYYNGSIYAVGPGSAEDGYKNHLMRIDTNSFEIVETMPTRIDYNIRDMAFDYTTGTMYGVAEGGNVDGSLCQINLTTGEVTLLGDTGRGMATLTCDADGQLYTITSSGDLCKIDKYTSEFTLIKHVTSDASGYQSMHYDHVTGNTYWGSASLALVDLETGDVSTLGYIGGTYMLVGCVFTQPSQEVEPKVPETTAVTGVSLPDRAAVVVGETSQFQATVLPVSVSQVDQTVTWSTSDSSVATVDEDGKVTGVASGTVQITATAGQYSDTCEVTVLKEAQKFFAYNETARSWVQLNTETGEMTTVKQETGRSPITAAAYTGETMYGYDRDGYFYEINPSTFERTKLSDGIHGLTRELLIDGDYYDVPVEITDLSYDPETSRLFGIMNGLYQDDSEGIWTIYAAVVEVNLEEGRENPYTGDVIPVGSYLNIVANDGYRPGNLLVQNGTAYYVDTWWSGILNRLPLMWSESEEVYYAGQPEQMAHVSADEWGMYYDSRSFLYDPVYDTYYILHDLGEGRGSTTLHTFMMGNAAMTQVCDLGQDAVFHSLFIR